MLLALFFIAWHPGFIGSESLTLTTYYPAPYGGYVSILTTGSGGINTLLARDGGNVLVGITNQLAPATQKIDVAGNIRSTGEHIGTLGSGAGQFRAIGGSYGSFIRNDGANTYMPLITAANDQYGIWNGLRPMYVNNATGDVNFASGQVVIRHTTGGIEMSGTGGISGLCRTVGYWVNGGGSCNGNERVFSWYGDNANSRCGMMFRGGVISNPASWTPYSCVGADYSGSLLCCRII